MKLYSDRGGNAPSPRRVRIFLAEKGLEIPIVELEIHVENRAPAFREKNRFQTLPVLELDDGSHLSESMAICRYLEELHPEPPLFGASPEERARVEMWTRRVELALYVPIELSNPEALPAEPADRFRRGAYGMMKILDEALAKRAHIAREAYSMADAFALSALDFGMRFVDYAIPEERPHLARWHAEVSARASARA